MLLLCFGRLFLFSITVLTALTVAASSRRFVDCNRMLYIMSESIIVDGFVDFSHRYLLAKLELYGVYGSLEINPFQ